MSVPKLRYEDISSRILNYHASCKQRYWRGNQQPFMNKKLSKEIKHRRTFPNISLVKNFETSENFSFWQNQHYWKNNSPLKHQNHLKWTQLSTLFLVTSTLQNRKTLTIRYSSQWLSFKISNLIYESSKHTENKKER